jgi:hypothetical protein
LPVTWSGPRKTAIHDGVYEDALAHYVNQGPEREDAEGDHAPRPRPPGARQAEAVRRAVARAAIASLGAVRATRSVTHAEPVMSSAGTLGVAAPVITFALSHLGVHCSSRPP